MKRHYEEWHAEARKLFDRERWITIGSKQANRVILYSQDWVGDYCDNPGGLTRATAKGYWNVVVDRPGDYEIELRRWPKESNKTLTEPWDDTPAKKQSARPITSAKLEIAGKTRSAAQTQGADAEDQRQHHGRRCRLAPEMIRRVRGQIWRGLAQHVGSGRSGSTVYSDYTV